MHKWYSLCMLYSCFIVICRFVKKLVSTVYFYKYLFQFVFILISILMVSIIIQHWKVFYFRHLHFFLCFQYHGCLNTQFYCSLCTKGMKGTVIKVFGCRGIATGGPRGPTPPNFKKSLKKC
jgi:hypothetical protein